VPGYFGDVPVKPNLQRDLDSFVSTWWRNIREQGFFEQAKELERWERNRKNLSDFVAQLKRGSVAELPRDSESWEQVVERISKPGVITEVTEDTYRWFLNVLPPRWIDRSHYCQAEGLEPYRLFWSDRDERTLPQTFMESGSLLCCVIMPAATRRNWFVSSLVSCRQKYRYFSSACSRA
jgi:hypothetical protein